jgi:hypothetical protein
MTGTSTPGAQTSRRGGAGPVKIRLDGMASPATCVDWPAERRRSPPDGLGAHRQRKTDDMKQEWHKPYSRPERDIRARIQSSRLQPALSANRRLPTRTYKPEDTTLSN